MEGGVKLLLTTFAPVEPPLPAANEVASYLAAALPDAWPLRVPVCCNTAPK